MPYLCCPAHGRDHENRVIAEQDIYREAGESVLVISGMLTGGPWQCDKCNVALGRGDTATLLTSFPGQVSQSIRHYEFTAERRYFAMRGKEVAVVYGAPWPAGDMGGRLRRAGE